MLVAQGAKLASVALVGDGNGPAIVAAGEVTIEPLPLVVVQRTAQAIREVASCAAVIRSVGP
jgi:hypothetical protein